MLGYGAHYERFRFAYARVFLAGVAEVFPGCMTGTHDPAGLHRDALVDDELAERSTPASLPVVVVSTCVGDQLAHFALAGGGRISDGVRYFVCQPERDQLWLEAKGTGIRIGLAGKMLECDEGHSAAADHEFSGIGGADADHQNNIGVDIGVQHSATFGLGQSREGHDIDACEHGAEVIAIGVRSSANDFLEVRSLWIEDVVGPVRVKDSAMRFEVAHICGDAICAVDDSEKIGEQVDQHLRQENTAFANAQQESTAKSSDSPKRAKHAAGCPTTAARSKSVPWHRISLIPVKAVIGESMTALRRIELRCPSCSHEFPSQTVVSTNWFGGKRTDFHERAAGAQPWAYQVHMCDRCGYSGAERDFTDQTDISPLVRERVWSELSPHVHSAATGSEKYEAAAKVAEWQGADPRYIGDLWLRAAWCCVDEGDVEAERYFRRLAAWSLEQALEFYDTVARDDRAVLVYLVGELWRRIGDITQANAWFDLVADEVTDPVAQRWIVEAALRQQADPREWFA